MRFKLPHGAQKVQMRGAYFKEKYAIGCHVIGDPLYLLFLHAIVSQVLLKYRNDYLTKRGFQCSSISSSPIRESETHDMQPGYSRYIDLYGTILHVWPDDPADTIQDVATQIVVEGAQGMTFDEVMSWVGQQDGIGKILKNK
jgi:hypothetical protein